MFSSLARLRAISLTLLSLVTFSHAIDGSLFTSSVTYCAPPETLLIQQFDIEYFAANQSISFNISAESVEANVNVTANMLVNVFGLVPLNITIDLCTILGGALCPLPEYNFTGSDSISLPDAFSSRVPDIAFLVPDLEGYAQLTLIEVGTGDIKACVQATLSNGLSTHQKSVEWTLGGITIFTLLVSMWQSLSPAAVLPSRLLGMISLFQSIAASSLLDLDYPVVYRSFALNFAWALSLFPGRLQGAINNMRALTGGGLANSTTSSAVGFVDRKLSPFNSLLETSSGVSGVYSLAARSLNSTLQQRDVVVVTSDSGNVLDSGLAIYVASMHVSAANAFMTVFLCTLILIAIALFVFGVGWASLFVMDRYRLGHPDNRSQLRHGYPSWVRAWTLRLCLIMSTPILVFAFYQWTIKDSWLSTLFSVLTFLAIMGAIVYPCFIVVRCVRKSEPSVLYTDPTLLGSYGPLYAQYRSARYHSFVPVLFGILLKAIFISFAQWSGMTQVILILLLEIALAGGVVVLRPHKTRGADVFSSFLSIVRVVCTGLMIAFVTSIGVKPIPRFAIGLVIAVIYSVTILIVIFNLVLHSGIQRLWKRRGTSRRSSTQGSSKTMLEKEKNATSPTDDSSFGDDFVARPTNPTPERNVPLDPEINQPYSPTTPTATMDYASTRQRDSQSTTFGSVLPRRWSFTPLHTPTNSSALDHSPPFDSPLPRTSEEHTSN